MSLVQFVILDGSTASTADAAHGGPLSAGLLQQIATALEVYLNRDVAEAWGGNYRVRVGSGPQDVVSGEIVSLIVDQVPEQGVVAYHTADGNSHPYVFVSRMACKSVLLGSISISCAMSHEFAETVADAACNTWRQNSDGYEYPQEVCDATESDTYEINGATVSNFALQSFFSVGAPAPWTYLGSVARETVPGPFGVAPGGYMMRRTGAGAETEIDGMIAPERLVKKRHEAARAYRRGARV